MRKFLSILMVMLVSGCASTSPELKAPCDPSNCQNRINVNTWYKG